MSTPTDASFYLDNPTLSDYFRALPPHARQALLSSGVGIASLGELQMWTEHFLKQ